LRQSNGPGGILGGIPAAKHELPSSFEDRISAVDADGAEAWGRSVPRSAAAGRPFRAVAAFVAAAAQVHALTPGTRNVRHFSLPKPVIHPWT
jgi:predicted nucleic acid-binding protein